MSEFRLPDQEARRRIVEDLDTCFLVEAGAGSGKTHSLVSRMVSLIASGRAETAGLAAITFTRKAAAELRERFQIRLEQAAATEADARRRQRLQQGVATLDRAFLGTIHSFCARLLRERPVEAGLDPAFQEIDQEEELRWSRAAWEAHLEEVRRHESWRLEALRELGMEPRELFGLFLALNQYPEVEPAVADAPRPDLRPVRQAFDAYLHQALSQLPRSEPARGWDDLQKRLRRMAEAARYLREDDDPSFIRLLESFEAHPRPTLNRWPDPETAREAQAAFEHFRDGTALPTLTAWREHVHRPAVEFVRPAVERAARLRERAGRASFQDLLLRAAALLREVPEVRRSLASRYTHLLVDEFQDTDPIQAEVVLLLTGTPQEETDWRCLTPRPGSLFVVGDPKQSIYRFRRADIDVYRQVREQLVRGGGEVLHLSANFRSVEPLIRWVNRVFQERFPREDGGFQPAYVPLAPVRPGPEARPAVQVLELPPVARHTRGGIAREDAQRVAAWIARACAGDLELPRTPEEEARGLDGRARPGDFLVLHRDRAFLLAYAEALEARGIPAEVTGAKGYASTWEVVAFLDLLALLADPSDPVKLLAVLRGPLFGLSDTALHRLGMALEHRWDRFLDVTVDSLPEPGRTALQTLQAWHAWSLALPAQAALEQVLDATGLLPWTAASAAGTTRAGNLVKLVEAARASGSGLSFPRLVATLREVVQTQELEAGSLFPGRPQAVRVMNLHRAKGLEAPVVVLAHPVGAGARAPLCHIRREEQGARGYFPVHAYAPGSGGPWSRPRLLALPPGWEEAARIEEGYLEGEEMRLLYVAATRARELLVVSRYPAKPDASPWHPLAEGGGLQDAPVLTPSEGPVPAPPQVEVTPAAVQSTRERSAGVLARARQATYLRLAAGELVTLQPDPDRAPLVPPTAAAEAAAALATWLPGEEAALQPGGVAWGRAAHRLLELLVREARRRIRAATGGTVSGSGLDREGLQALARYVAREEELGAEGGAEPQETLLRWVEPFLASDLWKRIQAASRVELEVPLALAVSAGELARLEPEAAAGLLEGAEEAAPVVIQGQADLLFREAQGWVLVDYKTDHLPGPGSEGLAALTARYGPQLRVYAEAWRRATGEPVAERWLYLVRYGRAVKLG